MSHSQQYINTLLERVPTEELGSAENGVAFETIRHKLVSAEDIGAELRTLYQVTNFSQVALTLLWISNKVENDPSLLEPTADEETMILSALQGAMGVGGQEADQEAEAAAEPTEEMTDATATEEFPAGESSADTSTEQRFSALVEKFVESIQSGSEDRGTLLQELLSLCSEVEAPESGAEDDFREFAQLLGEFIRYIEANQYFDDVRVMNITSNITEPVAQWASAAPEERQGLLESGSSLLRDFKTMFE